MRFLRLTNRHFSFLFLTALVIGLVSFIARRAAEENPDRLAQRNPSSSRSPASIEKVFDYSYLEGSALNEAAKRRVLESFDVETANSEAKISMGNFVLRNENQQKDFACGYYDRVSLTFEAEGVAVSGEKPRLTVETGCEVGPNINYLIPITIPVAKLKNEKPGNSEYKYFEGNQPMTLSLNNAPPDWPGNWILTDVKMTHSQNSARVLHLSEDEIKKLNSKPITMKW